MAVSQSRFATAFVALGATLVATVAPLLFSRAAAAQVFITEVLPPLSGAPGGAKMKDIADDAGLLVEKLDRSYRAVDVVYLSYVPGTGYNPPMSLAALGLTCKKLSRTGYYALGSQQDMFQNDSAAFMTLNDQMITTVHPAGNEESFIEAGSQNFVGWIRNMGIRHAAFTDVFSPNELFDQHDFLAMTLGNDLLESQWQGTYAYDAVGWATRMNSSGNKAIALLNETPVDLHPPGLRSSEAWAIYDRFQVGWGEENSGLERALVWSGSAASAFTLNPFGYGNCRAVDISTPGIVGYGKVNEQDRALFWKQTTNEVQGFGVIDLHTYLPPGAISSVAVGINFNGIIAGHFKTTENKTQVWKPVLWHPITLQSVSVVPNPVMGGLGATGTVTLSRPAPKGGVIVTLGPTNGIHLSVPASVNVLEGQTTATFPIRTYGVVRTTRVSISAILVHQRLFHTVTIEPISVQK